VRRGEIWWASLPSPTGSEPGFRRPVLIVQSDAFNDSRIATVMVAAITSNVSLAAAPGNVTLSRRVSGLPKPSVVNVSQVATIDKSRLTRCVRAVSKELMTAVDEGLRSALGL
jgi:mRNA interferase MazF